MRSPQDLILQRVDALEQHMRDNKTKTKGNSDNSILLRLKKLEEANTPSTYEEEIKNCVDKVIAPLITTITAQKEEIQALKKQVASLQSASTTSSDTPTSAAQPPKRSVGRPPKSNSKVSSAGGTSGDHSSQQSQNSSNLTSGTAVDDDEYDPAFKRSRYDGHGGVPYPGYGYDGYYPNFPIHGHPGRGMGNISRNNSSSGGWGQGVAGANRNHGGVGSFKGARLMALAHAKPVIWASTTVAWAK